RDPLVHQEAPELNFLGPIVAQLAQANRLAIANASQQPRAIFFRRSSPKYPMSISATASSSESRRQIQNHTGFPRFKHKLREKICAHASPGSRGSHHAAGAGVDPRLRDRDRRLLAPNLAPQNIGVAEARSPPR